MNLFNTQSKDLTNNSPYLVFLYLCVGFFFIVGFERFLSFGPEPNIDPRDVENDVN